MIQVRHRFGQNDRHPGNVIFGLALAPFAEMRLLIADLQRLLDRLQIPVTDVA